MTVTHDQANDIASMPDGDDAAGQYLTFMLAGEEYGLEILRVEEIKGWDSATPIPNTPEHVLGVLNLRGAVVPIIDLRKRFALESVPYTSTTVVIVVKMTGGERERTVGLVVDAVSEVYRLEASEIQPPPDMGGAISTEFVRGLATVDEKMLILLEIDHLIDFDAVDDTDDAVAESANEAAAEESVS